MAIFRTRPGTSTDDNSQVTSASRQSWYGDLYTAIVGTPRNTLAEEGSYYTIVNPTLATAIVGHVAPSLANNDPTPTKALLHIFNAGSKYIQLDYFKLTLEVVNASSTSTNFIAYVDNLRATGKTSGGSVITPSNTRSDNPSTSGATVSFGAVITAAATAVKKVAQWTVRPVIAVVEDQYTFRFGCDAALPNTATLLGTAHSSLLVQMPPVVIAPYGNFYLCEANPSGASTGATYEFEGGFWER